MFALHGRRALIFPERNIRWGQPQQGQPVKLGSLNPLMLMIMTQAWRHVKRVAAPSSAGPRPSCDGTDDAETGVPGGLQADRRQTFIDMDVLATHALSVPGQKAISDAAWQQMWTHPMLAGNPKHPPLSLRDLARAWDSPQPGIVSLESLSDLGDVPENALAIRVRWSDQWCVAWPEEWARVLQAKTQHGTQVWLEIPPTPHAWSFLHEHVCRSSIQQGWSWWCVPPTATDQFPAFLAAYRPLLRYWFSNPQSDQWAWPWCDIVVKKIAEHICNRPQDRYWSADQRQKQAWCRLEDDVWVELEKILGGPAALHAIIATVMVDINRCGGLPSTAPGVLPPPST